MTPSCHDHKSTSSHDLSETLNQSTKGDVTRHSKKSDCQLHHVNHHMNNAAQQMSEND